MDKKCGHPLEAGQGEEMNYPPELPERRAADLFLELSLMRLVRLMTSRAARQSSSAVLRD